MGKGLRACLSAATFFLAAAAARAEALSVPIDYEGRAIALSGVLDKPSGAGPFPVAMLLHGCGGNNAYALGRSEAWAGLLHEAGYATFIFDSFTARGYSSVCNNPSLVSAEERAKDIYAAALVLAGRPDIRPDGIAAIGFSHGGWAVLDAAAADRSSLGPYRERLAARGRIAAFIAFYPGCRHAEHDAFLAPLLILVGDQDGLSSATICQRLAAMPRPGGPELRLKVYPGAVHDFDYEHAHGELRGTRLAYDPAAAADARLQVAAFLREYLK
ncbi:MAG TPA: dienelactone hydrolase family protein [Stellaceae bacterium]|nr:dienelactone hydrolase family protein [Stellaceae bacterium]